MGTSAVRFESSVCSSLCKSRWGKLSSRISCRGSTCYCRTTRTRSIRRCFTSREHRCWSQDHVLPEPFSQRGGSTRERNRKLNTRISGKPCVDNRAVLFAKSLKIERCQGAVDYIEEVATLGWHHRIPVQWRCCAHSLSSSCSTLDSLFCFFDMEDLTRCSYTRTVRLYCVDISDTVPWICS